MPSKTDKLKLGSPFLSRRVKLLPCQKEMIIWWHSNTEISIRALARMFHVNRRLIQFILFPERKKRNLECRKQRGGSMQYYDKSYHKEKIREHRQHKRKTLKGI